MTRREPAGAPRTYAVVGGGANNNIQTNAQYATIPGGRQARASSYGQMAYASGQFADKGDAQSSLFVARATTTGAICGIIAGWRFASPRASV